MKRFFGFIMKHYAPFFYAELAYLIAVLILQTVLDLSEYFSMWALLPLNLISWPVAIAAWEDRNKLDRIAWRFIFGMVMITTMAPIFLLM